VAMLHEEVGAVLFGRDGVGRVDGDEVDDLEVGDVELEAGRGAGVGADLAGDDDRGLLREGLDALEDFFGDGGLGDDALDGSSAVAEGGEEELAGGADVVEPAAEGYSFAFVGGERGNRSDGCGVYLRHWTPPSLRALGVRAGRRCAGVVASGTARPQPAAKNIFLPKPLSALRKNPEWERLFFLTGPLSLLSQSSYYSHPTPSLAEISNGCRVRAGTGKPGSRPFDIHGGRQ